MKKLNVIISVYFFVSILVFIVAIPSISLIITTRKTASEQNLTRRLASSGPFALLDKIFSVSFEESFLIVPIR